uniref:Uncharacterized protein n=1 Tax=Panagrolaimus sp. PS1159 TaxID=55785 RepID=A0AC35GI23_9BILA
MKPKTDYRDNIERIHGKIYDNQIDIATDRDNKVKRAAKLTNSCSDRIKELATPKSAPTFRQKRKSYKSSNVNITTPNRLQKTPINNHSRTPVRKFTRKSGMNSYARIPTTPIRTNNPTSCRQPKILPSSLSSSDHLQRATPAKTVVTSSVATPSICESSNKNITTPNRLQKTPINNHPRTPTTPVLSFTPKPGMNSHSKTPIQTNTPTSCSQPKILPSTLSSSGHLQTATPTKKFIASSIAAPPICESKEFLAQQKTPSNCESVAKKFNDDNVTKRKKQGSNGRPCNQFTRSQIPLRSPAL